MGLHSRLIFRSALVGPPCSKGDDTFQQFSDVIVLMPKRSGKKQPLSEYAEFYKQSDQLIELLDTVGSNVQNWSLALPPRRSSCTDPVSATRENEAQSAAKLHKDMLKTMRECKEGQNMAMDCARAVLDKVRQLREELQICRANELKQE